MINFMKEKLLRNNITIYFSAKYRKNNEKKNYQLLYYYY